MEMVRKPINQWWEELKQSNPEEYKRRRNMAVYKARATRRAERLQKIRQSPEFQNRIEEIRTIRRDDWDRHLRVVNNIESYNIDQLARLKKPELINLINDANWAIAVRERDFELHYQIETGTTQPYTDFNRDDYTITDDMSLSQLRHIFRMQQFYLNRQNSWEAYVENMNDFIDRAFQKEGATNLPLEFRINFRHKFFDLYRKALEYENRTVESRGSPIYTIVAEELSKNNDTTIYDIMKRLDERYEQQQEEDRRREREAGIDFASFADVSDDDII